ncbi:MAG: ATP-binding protein [Candidatus Dormibacteraeota bacterium]|nr:ATP-binding protein [Candidatus Dormibacteraeota bacterium]
MVNAPGSETNPTRGRKGWSLRNYMALFMAVLIAVAFAAALAVKSIAEHDARQSASADSTFAGQRATKQLNAAFDQIRALSSPLVKDPSIAQLYADPTKCTLGFAPIGAFTSGHIDLLRLDGSVVCSSRKSTVLGGSSTYKGQSWLLSATPVVVAPTLDVGTGNQAVVISYPIAGMGAFAWFLDLAPLGAQLESEYGSGIHQLEFLITSRGGQAVVARSIDPARWIGTNPSGTAFAKAADPLTRPDLSGTNRIYAQTAIESVGWELFVGADEAAALSTADQLANRSLAVIVAGVSAMLVVAFVVYRRIAAPIRRLSVIMRSSTPSDAVKAVGGTGATEVTDLAEDFDRLMATVSRELADRLNDEQAAVVSEGNYRMLFEDHPQPMWLYDVDTLAFLKVNDAAVDQYGYSREEFLKMTIKDIRPPQDVAKLLELIGTEMPAFDKSGPWRHLLKDGSTVEVVLTSHAVVFDQHNARLALAEDLTESHRLELELNQSQARAESSAELSRAKDEMVSMVSHEMRTPLASIVGFTELLATREVTDDKRKEYLGIMLQEGHRLTALINDFLDLRRIEGGHLSLRFAPADITALIKRSVELFREDASIHSHTPVAIRLPDDLPLVRADSEAIFRVVANLLSNARKYSPDGGSIIVGAKVVNGMVEIYVQDEGLGIPSEALAQLFSKFYRVDSADRRAIKGTGLGLAISKNIVEAHGGKIGASSKGLGQGAIFYFSVPVVRDPAETGDVLVVEDDSGFAHLLEAELSARSMTSVWAPDAETAEHLMTKKKARAIVLDLVLPGLQGEAFLQRLRANYGPGIPVVIVTLKDLDSEEILSVQKAGVSAVLRKGPGMAEAAANLISKILAAEAAAEVAADLAAHLVAI